MATRRAYNANETYFKIHGNTVQYITTTVHKAITLDEFTKVMQQLDGIETPILPYGCKFYTRKSNLQIVVVEQPPQLRRLTWRGINDAYTDPNDRTKIKWRLALPYVIFVVAMDTRLNIDSSKTRMFYRTEPISDLSDKIYYPNLANIYSDGRICTGTAIRLKAKNLSTKVEEFISQFWQTDFNNDLVDQHFAIDASRCALLSTLPMWERSSQENSLFPLGVAWREAPYSLQDLITNSLR